MRLALIIAMPFLGALLPMLLARAGRRVCAVGTGIATLIAFMLLLTYAPKVFRGEIVQFHADWIPQLGMNLDFRLDGLGFLMAGLILGIGLLIILYAKFYLDAKERVGVFYTYLLVFQGAMVGIALSNNALCMLVFWELTSISSFLLIGFWRHLPEGRQGARMALLVTGVGGLALTAGMLLLGNVAGSYRLDEIIANSHEVKESPLYLLILGLIALGCFTKSAQFPFHFWLPRAMAAPTPVSAYLHSATMVKAGIFLLARLWPALSGTDSWFYLVTTVGLVTMLLGSFTALFKSDLKAIMAYSTVSHLGLMTMLLGFSSQAAIIACMFHLLNHGIFKASLFMNVGIIDHGTGTRELSRLGGLARWMPATAGLALLAISANAGLPPMNGFLSKELMLEAAWKTPYFGITGVIAIGATLSGVAAIAYSIRFFAGVYFGASEKLEHTPHAPGLGISLSPGLLAIAALAIGLFPSVFAESLIQSAVAGCLAAGEVPALHFHLWHGVSPAVYSSIVAIMLGSVLFSRYSLASRWWNRFDWIDGKKVFDGVVSKLIQACQAIEQRMQDGKLSNYLAVMLGGTIVLSTTVFVTSTWHVGTRPLLPVNLLSLSVAVVLVVAALATVIFHHQRLLSFIAANVVGLVSCIGFIYLSAPDLALTQISVEIVTLILILLAMYFLPKQTPRESPSWKRWRDGVLSGAAGIGMAGLTWAVTRVELNRELATYFTKQALPGSGGANVVNVIIVDFRGFDTFSEIAVLSAAALIIYSLLDGAMHGGPASWRLNHWVSDQPRTKQKHPTLMMIPTRVLLPMALLVCAYMFLRGHNEPGGGFVAGLIATIALIMQYMVSGYQWADERIRIDAHAWIASGLLLAAGTGVASVVMGAPFLTSSHGHFHLPLLGDLELSSAMAFDAGVFLAVVGAMMLTLSNLARLGRRAEKAGRNAGPDGMTSSGMTSSNHQTSSQHDAANSGSSAPSKPHDSKPAAPSESGLSGQSPDGSPDSIDRSASQSTGYLGLQPPIHWIPNQEV